MGVTRPDSNPVSDHAYAQEFLRRARNGGVWYPVLFALLYASSALWLVDARPLALVLVLAATVLVRRRAWKSGRASLVWRIALLQGLLFGTFVAALLTLDATARTLSLGLVFICGITAGGVGALCIPPGRHGLWIALTAGPTFVTLAVTAPSLWPLCLTIAAFAVYMTLQGQHTKASFDHALRDTARIVQAGVEKDALLSHLSHDIRTPMAAVLGYLQLAQTSPDEDDLRTCLGNAEIQLRSSLELLNHLLDVATMGFQQPTSHTRTFSPRATLEAAVSVFRYQASAKGVDLSIESAPEPDTLLRGPARAFTRGLTNLLSNAVRYTDAGSIKVHADVVSPHGADRNYRLELCVVDTGVGFPSGVIESLERIADGDTPRAHQSVRGGEGIGLGGIAAMLRPLDGTLDVETTRGGGSTVHLSLPMAVVGHAPTAAPVAPPEPAYA